MAAGASSSNMFLLENYQKILKKIHTKNIKGEKVPWEGGWLKHLDTKYPDAFKEVEAIFDTLGCKELMERCTEKYTQNINESAHSKLWRRVLKFKSHSKDRYIFACRSVVLIHNFGHRAGSLLYCIGNMSRQAEHDLHLRDMHSIRVAEARHEVIAGGYRKRHRNKYKVTVNYDNQNEPDAYDPGMEPIL